jgi:hypothetical protein
MEALPYGRALLFWRLPFWQEQRVDENWYGASAIYVILAGEKRSTEREGGGGLSQFHFISHKSDTHCPRIELGSPRGEAGV